MSNNPITYKDAGVDTEAGRSFVDSIKKNVHSTHNARVLGGLGGFAAAYDVSFLKNYKEEYNAFLSLDIDSELEELEKQLEQENESAQRNEFVQENKSKQNEAA